MIDPGSKEYIEINGKYKKAFGHNIGSMMLPAVETMQGLREKVERSIEQGVDLLPELYNWNDEDLY